MPIFLLIKFWLKLMQHKTFAIIDYMQFVYNTQILDI